MATHGVSVPLACTSCGSHLCSTTCYPTHAREYNCHVWWCPNRPPVPVTVPVVVAGGLAGIQSTVPIAGVGVTSTTSTTTTSNNWNLPAEHPPRPPPAATGEPEPDQPPTSAA
ncbi:hypothetical protein B0H66DRAFT_371184 [Apodospora peruviana]|uniref:Uncharacterized protein n=1 Tax=Apodospora peruviana TaxID=516989 RepID=A0AAE0HWW0_9PEZI|nr:hypothetical protein B0H66DRAFT_371184 [Apodospora peruviana]